MAMALAATAAAATAPAMAQKWTTEPSISLTGLATNNVSLESNDARESDFVTTITPVLRFSERGQRTRIDGSLAVPIVLYARTAGENNSVYPSLDLLGDIDLYERILHVEGAVNVAQQFFTPFGPQPADFSSATDNRYRTTTYRVSPYVKGVASNGISYEVRNNNVWSNLSGAPVTISNARYTEVLANVSSPEDRRFGLAANYDYTDTRFDDQDGSLQMQIGRLVPFYNVSPQFRFNATVGYEDNQGTLTESNGVVYGVGFKWRPTERTNVAGNWEHRFFGSSYRFTLDHRTPLTVWNVRISRDITTFPQELANFTGGTNVGNFLDNLYLSSIPDPAARQQAIAQFLAERGLPGTLTGPVTLYAQQIVLQQQQSATFGIVGARNTILFSLYNLKSEAITASGSSLPPIVALGSDNTQTGGSVVWTNRLTPSVNLMATLTGSRTVAAGPEGAETRQGVATITLSARLSGRMTGYVGGRYQQANSDLAFDYNEAAAFVGVSYTLR